MRSVEEKGCSYKCSHGATQENPNSNAMYFEFHKGNEVNRVSNPHRTTTLGKPTPSKWDDAQKWLVGFSKNQSKSSKPRNSNADDLRLIAPVPQKEEDYSDADEKEENEEAETKKVECDDESIWRINKPCTENSIAVRSICVRDMGTEMTPIASQEPSRTATPIRATTPAARSPIHSGSSTPIRAQNGPQNTESSAEANLAGIRGNGTPRHCVEESNTSVKKIGDRSRKLSPLGSRAMAWDEAERAKYMARFKREEVKIQAWENRQIRKAEMEMKKMEVPRLIGFIVIAVQILS